MSKLSDSNVLFYTALYWVACLPNGADHIKQLCEEYGQTYMNIKAPQKTLQQAEKELFNPFDTREYDDRYPVVSEKIKNGVSYEEAKQFLQDTLSIIGHTGLQDKYKEKSFMTLQKHGATSDMEFHFSDEIEAALIQSSLKDDYIEIDRQIIGHGMICVHYDGQAFAYQIDAQGKPSIEKFEYPGYPDIPHKVYTHITSEDIVHAPKLVREIFYRIIPLEEGQKYVWGFHTQSDGIQAYDNTAHANEVYTVDLDARDYDPNMSDEEILMHPTLGISRFKFDMAIGTVNQFRGNRIEATDQPNIVKDVSRPMPCMDVTEKIQIGYGDYMRIAEPGDKLFAEYKDKSDVSILRKAVLENKDLNTKFTFVDDMKDQRSELSRHRPQGPKLI
jgi:hypothetical protein